MKKKGPTLGAGKSGGGSGRGADQLCPKRLILTLFELHVLVLAFSGL